MLTVLLTHSDLSLKKNIYSNILTVLITLLPPFFAIPILTNGLGLGLYGQYMADLAFAQLLIVFTDLGFGMFLPRFISSSKTNRKVFYIVSSFFIIKMSMLPILLFASITFISNSENTYLIFIVFYIFLLNINLAPILNGLELYPELSRCTVFSKVVFLSLLFYFDFNTDGLIKIITLTSISQLVLFLSCLYYIRKYLVFTYSFRMVKVIIIRTMGFYFSKLFVNVYQQSSTYFVSLLLSLEAVAVYSIAIQLYKVGQAVIGAISKVLLTTLVKAKEFSLLFKITKLTVAFYLAGGSVIAVYCDQILKLLLTVDTTEISILVKILYISLFFVIFSSYYGYPALCAVRKDNFAHLGILVSAATYFICLILATLIFDIGLIHLVSCIFFADLSGMLTRLYYAKKFGVFNNEKLSII